MLATNEVANDQSGNSRADEDRERERSVLGFCRLWWLVCGPSSGWAAFLGGGRGINLRPDLGVTAGQLNVSPMRLSSIFSLAEHF